MPDSVGDRGRLVALVVLGLLVACAAGWWWFSPAPEAPPDESVVRALAQVHAAQLAQAGSSAAPIAASHPLAASAAEAAVDPSCPAAWRALAGKSRDAVEQVFRQLRPSTLAHASRLLAASSDPFERIAGRLLETRAGSQEQPPDANAYLALVSEALASSDPRIAALAIQLCDTAPPEHATACSSISPARWASVDPDNVQAWLAVASDALERSDARAARDALGRAAQARSSRMTWSELMQLAASPALQGLSAVERQVLAFDMITVGSLLNNNGMLAASRLCSVDAVAAPARRDECSAIAGLLIDQGETLLEHGIGIGLARRTGWPAERTDALAEEQRALSEAYAAEMSFSVGDGNGDGPLSVAEACEEFRRTEALLSLVRSGNEMQVSRRALQRQAAASSPG